MANRKPNTRQKQENRRNAFAKAWSESCYQGGFVVVPTGDNHPAECYCCRQVFTPYSPVDSALTMAEKNVHELHLRHYPVCDQCTRRFSPEIAKALTDVYENRHSCPSEVVKPIPRTEYDISANICEFCHQAQENCDCLTF